MRWVWVRVLDASAVAALAHPAFAASGGASRAAARATTLAAPFAAPALAAAAVASTQGRQLVVLCLHKA